MADGTHAGSYTLIPSLHAPDAYGEGATWTEAMLDELTWQELQQVARQHRIELDGEDRTRESLTEAMKDRPIEIAIRNGDGE